MKQSSAIAALSFQFLLPTCLIVATLGCSTDNQTGGASSRVGSAGAWAAGANEAGGQINGAEVGGGQSGGAPADHELHAGGTASAPNAGASAGGNAGANAEAEPVGGAAGGTEMPMGGTAGAANVYGGASRCQGSGFQLCEDFERGSLDPAVWTVQGQAPSIDAAHFARGSKALHVKVVGGQSTHVIEKKTFRALNDTYYGRVFVYLKSAPVPNGSFVYSHWTLLAAAGDGPGSGGEIRLGGQLQGGINRWGVGTDNRTPTGTGDWTNIDQDPAPDGKPSHIPTGTWMCIEWLHAGPDANQTKFWWDGVEHTSIATTLTEHGTKLARGSATAGMGDFVLPNFTNLWIGWQAYQGSNETFELWIDEIAIDHSRVGCDR